MPGSNLSILGTEKTMNIRSTHEMTQELRSDLRRVDKAIRSIERLMDTTLLEKALADLRREMKRVERAITKLETIHSRSQRKRAAGGALRFVRKPH